MSRIDDVMIRWATVAYLWLLDWTGVYVGTVGVGMMMFLMYWNNFVVHPDHQTSILWVVPFLVLWALPTWWMQHLGMNKEYNRIVQKWVEFVMRKPWICVLLVMTAWEVLSRHGDGWRGSVGWLLVVAFVYLDCVPIRDRERREHRYWNWVMGGAT